MNTPRGRLVAACLFLLTPALFGQKLDMSKLEALTPRNIGPAGMSGRVTAIDVHHDNQDIIYAGTASGGLWRSKSGGIHWEPIFDDQPVHSIGAVAVDQNNPDVIWVGTGEGNPRNSANSGDGIYKSIDGGKTWTHLGLKNSRNIHRLILHPSNPLVAYAGVQGPAWGESEERGVYKTTDGGKTWKRMLYFNQNTGVGDMVMDPTNPNKLLVGMWEFRRWPWFFKSGGPNSGIYVTHDGGETWARRTAADGLPKGELGRIGLAIARSKPDVIYALVESKKNALYRSNDGGFTWTKTADRNIGNRPFYYCEIYVDPENENRVYNIFSVVTVSQDGGKTFANLMEWAEVHPDHHAFYIHPKNANLIIDGNDGGLAISRDRGDTWRFVENLPLAQFYHIAVDDAMPYNVYGGMQDNGSWRGPAYVWRAGGIRNSYWEEVAFGDGFDTQVDRSNPRFGYAMSQGGNLRRWDLMTGNSKNIKPTHPDDAPLRFNWNAGLGIDPHDDKTIYYGSQHVHKSTDRGDTWTVISPDLTTNDPEKQKQLESGGLSYDTTQAENYTTIIAIEPSPLKKDVLWVGTDDGNVQLTKDGGASWENVAPKITGLPEGSWICQIRASAHEEGGAFVIADNHRYNDWTPYVFYTSDYGQTWMSMVQPDQVYGYALSLAQDPVEPNLIFLGGEFGLYITIDGGANWTKWHKGMPTASVMDMVIHPREHDLVMGTFGRSAWILDDIRPLRAMAQKGADTLTAQLELFPIPDMVTAPWRQASGTRFAADAMYAGDNRPSGMRVTFVSHPKPKKKDAATKEGEDKAEKTEGDKKKKKKRGKKAKKQEASEETVVSQATPLLPGTKMAPKTHKITVEVLQGDTVIRSEKIDAKPGLNRITYTPSHVGVRNPSRPAPRRPDARQPFGRPLMPGTYTLRLSHGDDVQVEQPFNVVMDPNIEISDADIQQREALMLRVEAVTREATEMMDAMRNAQAAVKRIGDRIKGDDDMKDLQKQSKDMGKQIQEMMELVNQKQVQGIRRDPNVFSSKLRIPRGYLFWMGPVTETEERVVKQLEAQWPPIKEKMEGFVNGDWKTYREAVEAANLSMFDD